MKYLSKKSLLGGFLSAIAVGAVSSGVWQYIMDPLLSSGSRLILNLATLGMDSFKNDLYREIAKGFYEKASSALYSQFNILFTLASIGFSIFLVIKTKELIQRKLEMMEELKRLEAQEEKNIRSIEEIREDLRNTRAERFLKAIYIFLVLNLVFLSAQFVTSKRDKYVNLAIAHYSQLRKIVSPYVTQTELMTLDSRFSQIQSAKNYKALISEMSGTARQNGAYVPEFEIWD
jgi:large-conductance mechanosensitive channel